jgi:hypothetical protein
MRMPGVRRPMGLIVAVILILAPRAAFACPVCFGQNDSPLALGINYGILAMLAIIVGLWIAFGSFFIYLRRRARLVDSGALPANEAGRRAGAATFDTQPGQAVPHAQGGTF